MGELVDGGLEGICQKVCFLRISYASAQLRCRVGNIGAISMLNTCDDCSQLGPARSKNCLLHTWVYL